MTVVNLRRWFRDPLFLLAVAAGLIAFVVQSGELGSADTTHRLQTAHAWWTGEPEVFPNEFPEFGVHGRGGKLQSWYSIGQSLILLPPDVVGAYIARLPIFAEYDDTDPSVRDIIVSYSINILVTVLTALVCFRFLRQLNFGVTQSVVGVLALLLATTHLHYTQNMMENNYIFLLTHHRLLLSVRVAAHRQPAGAADWLGGVRPQSADPSPDGPGSIGGSALPAACAVVRRHPRPALWDRCRTYIATALPVYLFFGLLDRLYQVYRFGFASIFVTYITIIGRETRMRNPSLPPNYPFETPWHVGFFGALFTPEKSIFLFDPLLVLMILLCIVAWKRFSPAVKAYAVMSWPLLLAYLSFYARYTVWSGDFAWGDRYVSTAVEFAALLAVPLLLRHREQVGRAVWTVGLALLAISTVIQVASLAFWLPLEIYQMETLGHPTFVIALAHEEHPRLRVGKDGRLGSEQPRHDRRPMGLRPHHHLEFSAVRFAPGGRGAGVGGESYLRGVGNCARRVGGYPVAYPRSPSPACLTGDFACILEQLPALQRNRHIAIVPDEVVELQHGKIGALHAPGIGEKLRDLELADLVRDPLPRVLENMAASSSAVARSMGTVRAR